LSFFFTALLICVPRTDPFERSGLVPLDGQGLNPLLRTVEMPFHPPMLYLGFVGSTVPFAIFLAGVWTGRLNAPLLRMVRQWTLFSWATLTAGIVLGAEWAYVELGWGGYWAWDPVENASLLGAAGSGYVRTEEMTLKAGESAAVGKYNITFSRMDHREADDGSFHEAKATLSFARAGGNGKAGTLTPAMLFYPGSERPYGEVSVKSGLTHDLYAVLSSYDEETASFKVLVYPLTLWMWIGGALMLAGGVAAMVPRKRPALSAAAESVQQKAAVNFCPLCGARVIQAAANFCANCGASFKEQRVEA